MAGGHDGGRHGARDVEGDALPHLDPQIGRIRARRLDQPHEQIMGHDPGAAPRKLGAGAFENDHLPAGAAQHRGGKEAPDRSARDDCPAAHP